MSASNTPVTTFELVQPTSVTDIEPAPASSSADSEPAPTTLTSESTGIGTSAQLSTSTSTRVVSRTTISNTPTPTDPTSTGQAATTVLGSPSPSASSSAAQTPSSGGLSTGSIVGIALGSVAAGIVLILILLFALGFRIQRAKWRRSHRETSTHAPELIGEQPVGASASGGPYVGKAELPDPEHTRRLGGLHNGAKPELDASGSTTRKSALWRLFSIRSVGRRGSRQVIPAELETKTPASGPHELPG